MAAAFRLRPCPDPGVVNAIVAPGVEHPVGFTRWALDGWESLSANRRPSMRFHASERAAAGWWARRLGCVRPRRHAAPPALVDGVDPAALAREILLLPMVQAEVRPRDRGRRRAARLAVVVRRGVGSGGNANLSRWRISLAFGRDADAALVRAVVAHEVCHLAAPNLDAAGRRASHGPGFRHLLRRVVRELWGVAVEEPAARGHHENLAYAQDSAIIAALRMENP